MQVMHMRKYLDSYGWVLQVSYTLRSQAHNIIGTSHEGPLYNYNHFDQNK